MCWISTIGVHPMNKSNRSILLLMALSLVAFSKHIRASEEIEGMRLFYTAEERMEEDTDEDERGGDHAEENANTTDVKTPNVTGEVDAAVAVGQISTTEPQLVFNAIVSLNDRAVAVINDLPCRIESARTSKKQLSVVCAQGSLSKYILTVSAGVALLNVFHGANKLASLAVGEKL